MTRSRIVRALGSAKLAAWIIGILIVMNLLSVLVPQRIVLGRSFAVFAERLPVLARVTEISGLDRLFTGWPIVVLSALLAVNVTVCTYLRLKRRRAAAAPARPDIRECVELSARWDDPAQYVEAVSERLGSRWRVLDRTDTGLLAMSGRIGFWGSMLLHASLLVLIVGGALTAVTSFRGELAMTEGESVIDAPDAYTSIKTMPRIGSAFTGTQLTLDEMQVGYQDGQVVRAVAKMRALEPSGRIITKDVRVNHPLDAHGKSYLVLSSGYAVALKIDVPGVGGYDPVLRLGRETPYGWTDAFSLPPLEGKETELRFLATPVKLEEGAPLPTEKYVLSDPHMRFKLVSGGQELWEGRIAEGEATVTPQGVRVEFEEMSLWNSYLVRAEPARWISYVGFWMAVAGALVRFAVPERRIALAVGTKDGTPVASVRYRSRPWAGLSSASDRALVSELEGLATGGQSTEGQA